MFYKSAKFYWQQTSITRDIEEGGGAESGPEEEEPLRSSAPQKPGTYRIKWSDDHLISDKLFTVFGNTMFDLREQLSE